MTPSLSFPPKPLPAQAAIFFAAALTFASAAPAAPKASDLVLQEVMHECKQTSPSNVTFFVQVPGAMTQQPTPSQEAAYIASEDLYKKTTAGKSPCWTRERWQRFVRAVLNERRATAEATSAAAK